MITSWFVAKSDRSVTPGSSCTASIHVPLALAKTSAVPSLWIWPARLSEAPKLNVIVSPSCWASKSGPIASWRTAVSDDAAKTVSWVSAPAEPVAAVPLESSDEHAAPTSVSTKNTMIGRCTLPPSSDAEHTASTWLAPRESC